MNKFAYGVIILFLLSFSVNSMAQGWNSGAATANSDSSRASQHSDTSDYSIKSDTTFKVPIATGSARGGIVVGGGLSVTASGVLSAAGVGGSGYADSLTIDGVRVPGDSIPQEAKVITWLGDSLAAARSDLDTSTTLTQTRKEIGDSLSNHYKKAEVRTVVRDSVVSLKALMEAKTDTAETRSIVSDTSTALRTVIAAGDTNITQNQIDVAATSLDTNTTANETRNAIKDSLGNHYKKAEVRTVVRDTAIALKALMEAKTDTAETRSIASDTAAALRTVITGGDTNITARTVFDSTRHLQPDSLTFRRTFKKEINFGTWVTDWELDTSMLDTIRVAARRCTVAGRLAGAYRATYPDTGAVQTIHVSSGILYLPTGHPKLDSISLFYRTLNNHADSGSVTIRVWEYDANLARTLLDSTTALISANAWTADITLTSLAALGRYDSYEIEAVFRVKGTANTEFNWVEIGRMRECFSY